MRPIVHAHVDRPDIDGRAFGHLPFQPDMKRRVARPRRQVVRKRA
jgi:hypothetical protein